MKIIGIGEVVWDCFPEGKRLGGAPINFCFFAKELGAESYPVTAIGATNSVMKHLRCLKRPDLI